MVAWFSGLGLLGSGLRLYEQAWGLGLKVHSLAVSPVSVLKYGGQGSFVCDDFSQKLRPRNSSEALSGSLAEDGVMH